MYSLALLTILFLPMVEEPGSSGSECPASPALARVERRSPHPFVMEWLPGATRLFAAAYPHLQLRVEDSVYVVEKGTRYDARIHYAHDKDSGYAALAFVYSSKHVAAIRSGEKMSGDGCRSHVELIIARVGASGAPQILARGPVDHEGSAIDIRTINIDADDGEPVVSLFHHAYYGSAGWFGYITWRAAVGIERGRLVTQRLPATYVKYSGSAASEMAGYLAPAGGDPSRGIARLLVVAFGSGGEVEKHIEVPLVDRRWISGVEILRQVP